MHDLEPIVVIIIYFCSYIGLCEDACSLCISFFWFFYPRHIGNLFQTYLTCCDGALPSSSEVSLVGDSTCILADGYWAPSSCPLAVRGCRFRHEGKKAPLSLFTAMWALFLNRTNKRQKRTSVTRKHEIGNHRGLQTGKPHHGPKLSTQTRTDTNTASWKQLKLENVST